MSNFYLLIFNTPWAGPVARRISGPDMDLSLGKPASFPDVEPFEYVLKVQKGQDPQKFPPLDYHLKGGQPLFSAHLRKALAKAGIDNIQYFPAKVTYEPTGQACDYQVANVLGVAKALDVKASGCTFSPYSGAVSDFQRIVLDEDKIQHLEFFRLYESLGFIIISKRVAEILKDANISAPLIIEPSEWQPGMW